MGILTEKYYATKAHMIAYSQKTNMKGLQPQLNGSSLLNANEYLGYVFTQL